MSRVTAGEFVLYRFYDADGDLLYIGKSVNVWSGLRHIAVNRRSIRSGEGDVAAGIR